MHKSWLLNYHDQKVSVMLLPLLLLDTKGVRIDLVLYWRNITNLRCYCFVKMMFTVDDNCIILIIIVVV